MPDRELTVYCAGGLCNRLKVLVSGLALAEASGRRFTMLWPATRGCSAPFASLFANAWHVRDVTRREAHALPPHTVVQASGLRDLLEDPSPDLLVAHSDWLVNARLYPAHAPLKQRCIELLEELEPIPAIRERIERFHETRFRPRMIGVHLRRGDFLATRPDVCANTDLAIAQVREFLAIEPDAGILLCTDDGAVNPWNGKIANEGVVGIFTATFGDRVVFTEARSLDRSAPQAIEDAAVDLFLLRRTHLLVGSLGSSFSELAVYGRDVTFRHCGAPRPGYARLERLVKATGIYAMLARVSVARYGEVVPLPSLYHRLITRPLKRRAQRLGLWR
jgi:hypothetical protein